MKYIKKIVITILLMVMVLMSSIDAYAATPRWSYLTTIAANLHFDDYNGVEIDVMCDSDAMETNKIKVVCELQQYNSSWKTIKSWTETRDNVYVVFTKYYAVAKNYSYRLKITAYTYKDSVLLEKDTQYLAETFYN